MTQTPTLPKTREEFAALAVRWSRLPDDVQETLLEQMTRAQRRQFESTVERFDPEKRKYAGKLTTREDVVGILALYNDRNIMPFAARLDQAEAHIEMLERTLGYMALPWYRRLWTQAARAWLRFTAWLETRGIRFTKLTEEDDGGDEADDHGDARGEASGRAAERAGELRGEAQGDRLPADDAAGLEPGRRREGAESRIQVVRR